MMIFINFNIQRGDVMPTNFLLGTQPKRFHTVGRVGKGRHPNNLLKCTSRGEIILYLDLPNTFINI